MFSSVFALSEMTCKVVSLQAHVQRKRFDTISVNLILDREEDTVKEK